MLIAILMSRWVPCRYGAVGKWGN